MLLGVDTTRMDIDMTEDHIHIAVDYQLDVNHEPMAECEIRMQITSKRQREIFAGIKGTAKSCDGNRVRLPSPLRDALRAAPMLALRKYWGLDVPAQSFLR